MTTDAAGTRPEVPQGSIDHFIIQKEESCISSFLTDRVFRIRKLPKALKDWQAFKDLKNILDALGETCPLLHMMANKVGHTSFWV